MTGRPRLWYSIRTERIEKAITGLGVAPSMKYYDSQTIDLFTDFRTRDYFHMLTSLNLAAKDPRVVLPAGQISRTCKCMQANAGSSCPANAAVSGRLHCLYLHRLQTFNFFEYQRIVVAKEQKLAILCTFAFILRLALQYSPSWLTKFNIKTHS